MRRCLAVALSVLAFAANAEAPRLELAFRFVVDVAPDEFGGLSGLVVAKNGKNALVLSDRGKLFGVSFRRDDALVIDRLTVLHTRFLYMYGPALKVDSEGLALGSDGDIYVSTEDPPTVLHYRPGRSRPARIIPFPRLRITGSNRWLEALAIDANDRLVTMPEEPPPEMAGIPIFRFDNGDWQQVALLRSRGGFSAVGADFGADGKLYVLERAVSALGFRTRIRRLSLEKDGVTTETLFHSRVGEFDNLEGISLWHDAAGSVRIMLVSDNNFLRIQKTEFVEFLLRE